MDNKIYRGQDGFYKLISEARVQKKVSDDYSTGKSQFVTSNYESDTHNYTVVEDIDNGVFYSVEKKEK